MRSGDYHLRAISHEIPQPSSIEISLKIIYFKFNSNFPNAKELIEIDLKYN